MKAYRRYVRFSNHISARFKLRHINLLSRVDMVMKGGVIYKQDGQPVETAL